MGGLRRLSRWSARRPGLILVVTLLAIVALITWDAADRQELDPRSLAATADGDEPDAVRLLLSSSADHQHLSGDRFEVWVCSVPLDTTDPTYQPSSLRLPLEPGQLAEVITRQVPDYFDDLSQGRYRPTFFAGGEVSMSATDSPTDCVNAALDASQNSSTGVLAVATAEQRASVSGGFGTAGVGCKPSIFQRCSARDTRRAAYVGASDFHPDWGERPPLDLVEHEIGHTLGWPHSGDVPADSYASDLDVMSNSAAPREADSTRRDGQGTLAVNQLAAGWLPAADVLLAQDSDRFRLTPSNSGTGPRNARPSRRPSTLSHRGVSAACRPRSPPAVCGCRDHADRSIR